MNFEIMTVILDIAHIRDAIKCLSSMTDDDVVECIQSLRKIHEDYWRRAMDLIEKEGKE
jgi:hypothetical protein